MGNNSFEYEERAVAFIDVLGFANLVQASESDLAARKKIGKLLDLHDAVEKVLAILPFASTAVFSDSIVISVARPDQLLYLVREVGYLSRNLLLAGLPCRGAITVGPMYHHERKVVGPALIEAYRLEQSVAVYPRVILDDAAMDYWRAEFSDGSAHPHLEPLVKRDRDRQFFLDIFNPEWGQNFVPWTEFAPSLDVIPVDAVTFIKAARKQISTSLAAFAENLPIRKKYEWLASECNERAEQCQ